MLRNMPFTNWIGRTWSGGGCGGHVVFGILLVFPIGPLYLMCLPFDLLIGAFRSGIFRRRDTTGLIALDLETTGLDPSKDEILSVAIVDSEGRKVLYELVRPKRRRSWKSAERVNGISPEMVRERPTIDEFIPAIQRAIDGSKAVLIYNEAFDRRFLEAVGVRMTRPVIDVMKEYAKGGRWRKLTDAAKDLGVRFGNAHDAMADAKATMEVYRRMRK